MISKNRAVYCKSVADGKMPVGLSRVLFSWQLYGYPVKISPLYKYEVLSES